MPEESTLGDFQDALAELLSSGLSAEDILQKLKSDERFESYRAYIDTFDIDMVEVACELMGKWAKRKDTN